MEAIQFTSDEITTLHDAIENCLGELRTEISYTDDRAFKAALKRRQEILRTALEKLAAQVGQMT